MYLAIDGVIGVGKTTLAHLLQPVYNAELLLEVFEENPFLSDFYSDRARYAFQTQIFFLLSRYRQHYHTVPTALAAGALVADYTFAKDALFARINLRDDEQTLYHRVHDALAEKIPPPDLVVFLNAPVEVLLERIAQRGRTYEKNMERAYIAELHQAYEEFFAAPGRSPVLRIDTENLNFVHNPNDLGLVIEQIQTAMRGINYQSALPLANTLPTVTTESVHR